MSLELALTLKPDTRHIVVVTGASAFDKGWEKTARENLRRSRPRHDVVYLAGLPLNELLIEVSISHHTRPSSISRCSRTPEGSNFCPATSPAGLRPQPMRRSMVSDTYVGSGIVGATGQLQGGRAAARRAGEPAFEGRGPRVHFTLRGKTHRYIVDWRQLDPRALQVCPAGGTELRFKPASMWELNKREILFAIALILLQTVVLVKSLLEIKRRKQAEANARQSEERMDVAVSGANLGLWNWNVRDNAVWATEHCRQNARPAGDEPLTLETFCSIARPTTDSTLPSA